MSSKSKIKGTQAETRVVKYLKEFGIDAKRKALTGNKDEGDIDVVIPEYGGDYILEVKSGKMTANPTRKQIDEWLRQTKIEEKNSGAIRSALVIARHGKNPKDYDVLMLYGLENGYYHMYLDDFCKEISSMGQG